MEFNLHTDLHVYRFAILQGRLKTPLLHGLKCLGIEAQAETANYFYVPRASRSVDNEPKNARALFLGPACLFCVVGIGRGDCLRRRDSATNFVDSPTDAAAATCPNPSSVANADPAARASTDEGGAAGITTEAEVPRFTILFSAK